MCAKKQLKKQRHMSKPTFYIVTPSFNQAHFIEETIIGVLKQKGNFALKYIVMDGKSKDNTIEILKKYEGKIKWVSEKDKGQADAINKGIKKLFKTSDDDDIFAYINSDDFYTEDAFKVVLDEFSKNKDKFWLVGDAVIVDEKGKEIQKLVRFYKRILRRWFSKNLLYVLNPIPQPSTFIKVSVLNKTGFFNEKLNYTMDYEYWLRLLQEYGNPVFTKKTLSSFRIHKTSKGGNQFINQFDEEINVAKYFTDNNALLFLHKLHNSLIVFIYKILK